MIAIRDMVALQLNNVEMDPHGCFLMLSASINYSIISSMHKVYSSIYFSLSINLLYKVTSANIGVTV